jgi:hypothetical protein
MTNKTYYVLLNVDMSFALSGIDELTNGVAYVGETEKEVLDFVKKRDIKLGVTHMYHQNYDGWVIQKVEQDENK